jgi:Alcohol dehydrogenase, class IV
MWYFVSPQIVFGEGALDALDELEGRRALIVTDATLVQLGIVEKVLVHLKNAGLEVRVFDEVEPDPSVATVLRGAEVARAFEPDWIIGLGGGSPMDAAKAIWILYERPDLHPAEINPFVRLGLRQKARLITIPTTSGTGAEITWAIVLTDTEEQRKMGLGNRENVADMAIVDPALTVGMPPRLTADTGMDALTHAVEGYTCTWHNDISDGLCIPGGAPGLPVPAARGGRRLRYGGPGADAQRRCHRRAGLRQRHGLYGPRHGPHPGGNVPHPPRARCGHLSPVHH